MPIRQLPVALAWVLAAMCLTASAAEPRLDRLEPQGAQRGAEATIVLHGGRLGKEPGQLLFYREGIAVKELTSLDDNRAQAVLALAADCPLGIHAVRVRTSTGLSNLMTFHVGALPEMAEAEPNSEPATPQAAPLGTVVNGTVTGEDVDYYQVEAAEGQRISAEIEGIRLGRTFFDPRLAILDATGKELAACDDAPLLHQDAHCSILAPTAGKYLIAVRESAFGGNDACTYRLHIGAFARPLVAYPLGGKPGETLEVRWIGDPRGERKETVTLPTVADADNQQSLFVADELGAPPSGNPVRLVDLPNVLEVEPNNDREQALQFAAPAACNGILETAGDRDNFRFAAKQGETYDIRMYARTLGSPLDGIFRVRDAAGTSLVGNDDDQGKPDAYLRFAAPADGDYYLEVEDHLQGGGPAYGYRLELTPVTPAVEVQFEELIRYESQMVELAAGNRMAVMATASRRDVGGPLTLEFGNLPPGVTAEALPLTADDGRTAVLFSAADDAAPAATLATVKAVHGEPGTTVASNFRQQTWLVRGANNVPVWSHFADRAAVSVNKKIPFRLKLVEPTAPLVRGGEKSVLVVAERDEGFTAPIGVRMLYNPPGVSSNASLAIAEGQTEVAIPMTADGGAVLRDWRLIVLGETNIDGRVVAASPFATVTVAEPFIALTFATSAAVQGTSLDYAVAVEVRTPFEGQAKVELLGLPPGVTAEPLEFDAAAKEMVFKLQLAADARVGRHRQLFCRVTIQHKGEPVVHSIGTGELGVDPAPKQETAASTEPAGGAS